MRISSVQRDDTKPEFITYPDDAACRSELARILSDLSITDGITAVIAHDDEEARDLWGILNDIVSNDRLTYVAQGSTLPDHGVVLITLKLAKGLEFDHVIIPNANEGHYPETPLAQHQLYTAISRATKTISLLAKEEFTPLLKKVIS